MGSKRKEGWRKRITMTKQEAQRWILLLAKDSSIFGMVKFAGTNLGKMYCAVDDGLLRLGTRNSEFVTRRILLNICSSIKRFFKKLCTCASVKNKETKL
jgi:hypothetical protein